MKRVLYALAALWLEKTGDRRAKTEDRSWKTGGRRAKTEERSRKTEEWGLSHDGIWLPEARNGLLYHLNAMMRMGESVRELATRECTHVPSRESAKEQPSESAHLKANESPLEKTDNHLPKRVIVSEHELPAERIGEPLPIAQVLARVYLHNAPRCAMGEADEKAVPVKQPGSASSDSAKPNSQPLSLAPRRTVPLTSWVLALFMCLLSAQQVSAQAEPAVAAVNTPTYNILSGTVKSAATNMPIEGAMIRVKETGEHAFSDTAGKFSILTTLEYGGIEVSFSGYERGIREFQEGALRRGQSTFLLQGDVSHIPQLYIGDSVPNSLWDMPLSVVNHPEGRSVITLREYQDRKLLVLDFWATFCAPCVKTIDAWETVIQQFTEEIAYLTVYVDFQHRALPFIQKRGWVSPAIVGEAHWIVNRYFFSSYQLGGVVMIYQGKLFAIPENKGYESNKLRKLLAGESVDFESDTAFARHSEREGV